MKQADDALQSHPLMNLSAEQLQEQARNDRTAERFSTHIFTFEDDKDATSSDFEVFFIDLFDILKMMFLIGSFSCLNIYYYKTYRLLSIASRKNKKNLIHLEPQCHTLNNMRWMNGMIRKTRNE
jgi:hypothetical protein